MRNANEFRTKCEYNNFMSFDKMEKKNTCETFGDRNKSVQCDYMLIIGKIKSTISFKLCRNIYAFRHTQN